MKQNRYSLILDPETISVIDEVARKNNASRSAVVRMFLDLTKYIPVDKLQFSSPIPQLLGLSEEDDHASR